MTHWNFTHSIFTQANRKMAWAFLSDMSNQVRMESAVEAIELDGPFASGTIGRTITKTNTQEWELREVNPEERFTLTGHTPNRDMMLSFTWEFSDKGTGTQLTQHINAEGPNLETYSEIFQGMEEHAPQQMAKLAEELDRMPRNEEW